MKSLYLAFIAVLFAACYSPSEEGMTEEKFSSKEQAIVVCSSQCAQPTYNGNPVACASNIYCYSDPGGAYCLNSNNTWSNYYCQAGQPPIYCGDGTCNGTDTPQNCPADCGPPPPTEYCGDGICQPWIGEGGWNCSECCPRGQQAPCMYEP